MIPHVPVRQWVLPLPIVLRVLLAVQPELVTPVLQMVLSLRGSQPRETALRQPLCTDIDGFSLYAAVRVEAHDGKRLEQL